MVIEGPAPAAQKGAKSTAFIGRSGNTDQENLAGCADYASAVWPRLGRGACSGVWRGLRWRLPARRDEEFRQWFRARWCTV